MIEFEISSFSLINIERKIEEINLDSLKKIRDDIIGNNALKTAYFQMGIFKKLQNLKSTEHKEEKELIEVILKFADRKPYCEHEESNENFTLSLKDILNEISDEIEELISYIDGLNTIFREDRDQILYLDSSPFFKLSFKFLNSIESSDIQKSKLLTFLAYLSFENDTIRKNIVDSKILHTSIKSLSSRNNELRLSSCLLIRSVSRSVKLIRTELYERDFLNLLKEVQYIFFDK
jgi:hypothetical protein